MIDFRQFNLLTARAAEEIIVRPVDTTVISGKIGQRKIKQLELLYNNVKGHLYDMELLVLIACATNSTQFEMFGA